MMRRKRDFSGYHFTARERFLMNVEDDQSEWPSVKEFKKINPHIASPASGLVDKHYVMNPREDQLLLSGMELFDGALVLPADLAQRSSLRLAKVGLIGLITARKWNRWMYIERISYFDDEDGITWVEFQATYNDGTVDKITVPNCRSWLLKNSSAKKIEPKSKAEIRKDLDLTPYPVYDSWGTPAGSSYVGPAPLVGIDRLTTLKECWIRATEKDKRGFFEFLVEGGAVVDDWTLPSVAVFQKFWKQMTLEENRDFLNWLAKRGQIRAEWNTSYNTHSARKDEWKLFFRELDLSGEEELLQWAQSVYLAKLEIESKELE
jgi:hypothetical protein